MVTCFGSSESDRNSAKSYFQACHFNKVIPGEHNNTIVPPLQLQITIALKFIGGARGARGKWRHKAFWLWGRIDTPELDSN